MIEESELITLLIGIGVFIFIIINFRKLKEIPKFNILLTSFTSFLIGWTLTVLESFMLYDLFNLIEHICYITASICIFLWIVLIYKEKDNP